MTDVVRVHEYSYVHMIMSKCGAIKAASSSTTAATGGAGAGAGAGAASSDMVDIAHLDADTALCRTSFAAAMRAAGAVCQAIDRVVDGSGEQCHWHTMQAHALTHVGVGREQLPTPSVRCGHLGTTLGPLALSAA